MKGIFAALLPCLALSALAAARGGVSALPSGEYADTEVSTNVALNVNAARLERLTIAVSVDSCETNEVLVALGADADDDGDQLVYKLYGLTDEEIAVVEGRGESNVKSEESRTVRASANRRNATAVVASQEEEELE